MTRPITAALAAAVLVACAGDEHEPESILDMRTALLVTTRDHLQVCLQIEPSLDPARAEQDLVAALRADLEALRDAHPDWRPAGLDARIDVAIGCPGAANVIGPVDGKGAGGAVVGPGMIARAAAPSPFRVHVHAIDPARSAAVLGDQAYARAIAELVEVDDHRVAEVSTALIVPTTALGTAAFRDVALAQSLGLRPQGDQP